MNKGQWDSLPQEYKDIIDGLSGYEASMGAAQVFEDAVVAGRKGIEEAGCEFLPGAATRLVAAPLKVYILLLILGCGSSALAYVCWTNAFAKAKQASTVSNYMFINPFISTFFGWLMIGDPIEASAIWGGALIMLGLALFNFGPRLLKKPETVE